MDVEILLRDYNLYRSHTQNIQAIEAARNFKMRPLTPTTERINALRAMAVWCVQHGVDPRLWLYTLFQSRAWSFPPPFTNLTPAAHLPRYQKAQHLGLFKKVLAIDKQKKARAESRDFDPNRDISPVVEARKASFTRMGLFDECMRETPKSTYGYHPKSPVCLECPIRDACAKKLTASMPFDILALRRGELDLQEARQAARDHYQRIISKDTTYGRRIDRS